VTYRTSAERANLAWWLYGLSPIFTQAARAGMKQIDAEEHYYAVARAIGFAEADAYALLGDVLPTTEDEWRAARQPLYAPPSRLAELKDVARRGGISGVRAWLAGEGFCTQMDLLTAQMGAALAEVERLRGAVLRMAADCGPPPLAIDGHAYRQRQRNRVKRGRR